MNSRKLEKEGLFVARRNPFKSVKALYDSVEPPEISYKKAIQILNNQDEWEKLNFGGKLNVTKVYSYGIAGELDIKAPDIHIVRYKSFLKRLRTRGNAPSIEDGIFLSISRMKYAINVRKTVAEESKHIHQFYAIDSDYKPQTLPSQEVIDDWKNKTVKSPDGTFERAEDVNYYSHPMEIDAHDFKENYINKIFGESKECIADNFIDKIVFAMQRQSIRKMIKEIEKETGKLEPEMKEKMLNYLKIETPELKEGIQNYQNFTKYSL